MGQVSVPLARQLVPEAARELPGQIGIRCAIRSQSRVPVALPVLSPRDRGAEVLLHIWRHQERGLARPTEVVLGGPELLGSQRRAVRLERVLLVRRSIADDRADQDERWL